MAVYHLSLKVGTKGKAAPHFNYITASEKYAAKRGVVHVEHGNMPLWVAAKPALFWEASDEFERANGTAYRELEVSLPRELPLAQQVELARQLAEEACSDRHAFSFAIHHTKASDGGMNPHVHLQFSERVD
ncbi:MobA/MobL family protein, partial [Mariprofundus ferrooxydans]|uniref:MobA/MobL family protein n=1 Tax=Mariprofundus ferrooxydans TaxID=314344 RepID=UPI000363EC3E